MNNLLLFACVCLAGLVACRKTTQRPVPESPLHPDSAYVRFTVTAEGGETVRDGRLLVFRDGSSQLCEFNMAFNGDHTPAIRMISGARRVFVVANVASRPRIEYALDQVIEGQTTATEFLNDISRFDPAGHVAGLGDPFAVDLVVDGESVVMGNAIDPQSAMNITGGVTREQCEAAAPDVPTANSFTITVKPVVAQCSVSYAGPSALTTADNAGELSQLVWTLRGQNRSIFLVQRLDGTTPCAPYYNMFINTPPTELGDPALFAQYFYNGAPYPASPNIFDVGLAAQSCYTTENTSLTPCALNTTCASIRAVYTPHHAYASVDYLFGQQMFANHVAVNVTPGTTLYRTTVDGNGLPRGAVFTDRDEAYKAAYLLKNPAAASVPDLGGFDPAGYLDVYVGGQCYYRLYFGEGDNSVAGGAVVFGVHRAGRYSAIIKSFDAIGSPVDNFVEQQPDGKPTEHIKAVRSK
ncbi:MAG: hypothetical protein LBH06_00350 [Rikenellaceae bacterium]|nr:hypothetical protein [Rikenellaceae bacterium]